MPFQRNALPLIAAVLAILVLLASQAALADGATGRVATPKLVAPADGAAAEAVPAASWRAVRRAAKYEFQLAADPAFRSIVLGRGQGSFFTRNTFATIPKALADGTYYWRARAVDARDRAGRWSEKRSIEKRWNGQPVPVAPAEGAAVSYPAEPLVLRWAPVPRAFKYLVQIATDPELANTAFSRNTPAIETSGTVFAMPRALAPGRYYWAVTPLDAQRHPGRRSQVSSFVWSWPSGTATRVSDLDPNPRVMDPQFAWNAVPGAARYEVEVNPSEDFAVGSRVCCNEPAVGTSLSPLRLLPNNRYFWRVRAIDLDGNAGVWNVGPAFTKDFNNVVPQIPGLRVRDNVADSAPPAGPSGLPTTDAPVISWLPVHGASSYEVAVAPWEGFCNWTARLGGEPMARTSLTATTSWTPLGPNTTRRPVGNAFPTVANDSNWALVDGTSYCVRVRARSDRDATNREIVSDWTQLGGAGAPAFTFAARRQECAPAAMPQDAYNEPTAGTVSQRMPLFTWDWVPGACGYFVVVARDPEFTKVVDVALTTQPAYAPRTGTKVTTYADETSLYYWAVLPTRDRNGEGLATEPGDNHPQSFHKRSVPPALLSPAADAGVPTQPAFRWSAAEGAREYRIQVDADPTFGSPIADVVTNATAYTSAEAFPADNLLYWRVRANDENRIGLTWSETRTFRRRLPTPGVLPNPLGGEDIPLLAWQPVEGAVSYDMHVEQVDGTKRDFNMRSTAFTPIAFYGTGVWHWQVRANFPAGPRTVAGGYFAPQPFTRHIATPFALRSKKSGGGALLTWDPPQMAMRYRVEVSMTDSFSRIVEQATTDNTSWAPRMTSPAFFDGSRLYWRVATMDEGRNLGGWATRPLSSPRRARMALRGSLQRNRLGVVRVTVRGRGSRPLAGAIVRVRGAGIVVRPRQTNRRGVVRVRIRPRVAGVVQFTADKYGYAPGRAKLRVR